MEKEVKRLKLHGFNNLTKSLSFNMYDICYTKTVADREAYLQYIDEQYNADRLTEILTNVSNIIGANILNIAKQDYEPQGASVTILIAEGCLHSVGAEDNSSAPGPLPETVLAHLDKSHITVHTYPEYNPDDKYIYINGEPYIEKLNKVGIVDITTAERADIVDAFEGEDVDYVVFIEVQPFIARDKVTFFTVGKDITTTVPLKIIDLVNGKYLYNGKFTEKASDSTMIGGIGNKSVAMKALNKINEQITSVLTVRLPEEKSVAVAADKK